MSMFEAFIIMPYKEPYESIYGGVISKVLNKHGFNPIRADQIEGSSSFYSDISERIRTADLVIAELSEVNPNVYFELGQASAFNKDIILITGKKDSFPSDISHLRHLVYDHENFSEFEMLLSKWIKNSRAFKLKSQKKAAKVLNRGDVFPEITDATFYLEHWSKDDRRQIIKHIRNASLIPTQYLYKFDRGSSLWLGLCQDAEYKYFGKSVSFFTDNIGKILDSIGNDFVSSQPDYISLGPGNGVKDRIFLTNIMERQTKSVNDIFYYPFDISPTLISNAIQTVVDVKDLKNRLKIKAIVSDFSKSLKSFTPVYQYRPEPNIFTLLGNTLGNMDKEVDFLYRIKEAMFIEDVLIVEVRLKTNRSVDIGGSEHINKKFDFTPLDMLGVDYDSDRLRYVEQENRSNVPDTRTVIATYNDFKLPGDEDVMSSAYLSYIHEYDPVALRKVIEKIGLKILWFGHDEGLACFVLKKSGSV
ncbi:MAG: L-histidine N(alpha)-methyltransferase [Magnetococcus sp. DMHC-1]|nr:L-histidine N(alpha)-methyltransferase [Magnetococcales bacterium]